MAVALSAAAVVTGFAYMPRLLQSTTATGFDAPRNSLASIAERRLHKNFPLFANAAPLQIIVAIRALPGFQSALTEKVANWSRHVRALAGQDERVKVFRPLIFGYYLGVPILGLLPKDAILEAGFVSADNRTTVLVFMATKGPPTHPGVNDGWKYRWRLMDFMHEIESRAPEGTQVKITGNPVIEFDRGFDHSIEYLLYAEKRVLPIALLILAYLVREVRLLIIPPLVLAVSFLSASIAVYPVTKIMPLSTDVPPAMVSLTMALSLDYSLFLLTRFTENKDKCMSLQRNVDVLARHTGQTLATSGLLIAIAFFGAMVLPEVNLRGAGLALGVTTLTVLVVSMTLTPALLILLGNWLTSPATCFSRSDSPELDREALMSSPGQPRQTKKSAATSLLWFKFTRLIAKYPVAAIAATMVVFLPVCLQVTKFHGTADAYAVLPGDMTSIAALRSLQEDFPMGRFDPFAITISPKANLHTVPKPLMSEDGYTAMLALCDSLREVSGISTMLGPTWMMYERVDWRQAAEKQNKSYPLKFRTLYQDILHTHVNGPVVMLQVHTEFLPRAAGAATWVERVRGKLRQWELDHPEYEALLSGGAALLADTRKNVMSSMHLYVGASLVAIVLVVFFMFGSLMLPLRLGFALLFTIGVTFGVAVIVYQTPLLHGIFPWLKNYNGICFQVIPIAMCVAVALGLDYDIFLISRIIEYRRQGLSDASAIVKGVGRTGGIISGAGIIMSLAFSGMFFSPKLMHQQFACLLVTSVLLDTFVVRTVLVPALMFSAGDWNWWPHRMPLDAGHGSASEGTDIDLPEDDLQRSRREMMEIETATQADDAHPNSRC